ncbi:MAG TPA: hypothetical protein VM536_00750 [Chloroflexia bacterium]|nr:hypothetical protein [Chloroflexia bacterium]
MQPFAMHYRGLEQVRETLRMRPKERPDFTPGFPPATALQHKVRIAGSSHGRRR